METQVVNPVAAGNGLSGPRMSDPKERFFRHFQHEITAIQEQIDNLATLSPIGGERQDCQDTVLSGISRLSNEVLDAADFIPAYDQRAYTQAIKALTEKFNEATGKYAPKSRFQFKKKPTNASSSQPVEDTRQQRFQNPFNVDPDSDLAVANPVEARDSVSGLPNFPKNYNEEMARPDSGSKIRKPSFSTAKNIAIFGHSGLHIILPSTASRATSSGSLTDLNKCVVDMSVPTSTGAPFAGLALKNINKSLIIAGHVAGPAHITSVKDSVIVVAARQVRIHECENVDVYLLCASHPIIEDCKGMRFAPLPDVYLPEGEKNTQNQWDQVDDFKWLKTEPSPNWAILPEESRLNKDIWTKCVGGSATLSTDDILRKVGI